MSNPHTFQRGAAPRHLELARQAIRRAEQGVEPLDWAITRAIDCALAEAADVAELTADLRTTVQARALAILRLRGSLSPAELTRWLGARYLCQGWSILQRLVVAGFARKAGRGRYVVAQPHAVGRRTGASRARADRQATARREPRVYAPPVTAAAGSAAAS